MRCATTGSSAWPRAGGRCAPGDEREYRTAVQGLREEIKRAGGRARLAEVANRIAREHGMANQSVEATAKAAGSGFTVDADGWVCGKGQETEAS